MASSLLSTIRDLHRRRGRERRGLALAEGVRLVEEALAAGVEITGVALAPALEATTRGKALTAALVTSGVPLEKVDDRSLAGLAATEHPQGVVVVYRPRVWQFADLEVSRGPLLVLDAVQDPGNVGTMVRTADALGAGGVVALTGTADLTNPKAVRAAMGSSFRLPTMSVDVDTFGRWAQGAGLELRVAATGGAPIGSLTPILPLAVVVGNEGAGISGPVAALGGTPVGIPLREGVESLNVAVAAGILLYEVTRDR